MAYSILIAEDDPSIAKLIGLTLTSSGYQCTVASDGEEALRDIESGSFQMALLDIMIPGRDGFDLLEMCKLRGIPVIFVTAKASVPDRVQGLRSGAEDYIVKPFDVLELLARVEVVLRRYYTNQQDVWTAGDLKVDFGSRKVFVKDEMKTLTPKEYELLVFLLQNPNIAFSRERLLSEIWGYDFYGSTRTVDTHVLNLRAKLGMSDLIQTVHKIGYRLELP